MFFKVDVKSERIQLPRPSVQEALRVAFDEHYTRLLRLCTGLTGRRDVGEEIVQEAFVRVAGRIADLGREDVGPYLVRVVVNLWKNRLRRLAIELRHRRTAVPAAGEALSVEERDSLWAALLRLPDRQRACLVLRFYEGLTEREVAEALGCSTGTVKTHTSRGLHRLRKELHDED